MPDTPGRKTYAEIIPRALAFEAKILETFGSDERHARLVLTKLEHAAGLGSDRMVARPAAAVR